MTIYKCSKCNFQTEFLIPLVQHLEKEKLIDILRGSNK